MKLPNGPRPILVAIAIAAVAGTAAFALGRGWVTDRRATDADAPTYAVRRGPLTISVVESGTIRSLEQDILKNEVEGQTTILYLIPEGTVVKEGDLLVELDASGLEDNRVEQQIRHKNAEATYIRAREDLEVAKSQAESDIAKAELDARFAEEDVTQYVEGEFPQLLKEHESRITLAREEKERAAEKLEWSTRLFGEKYISETELQADRLASNRATLDYELEVAALDLLRDYTYRRRVAELESNVDQTRMALDRVRRKASADVVQAEAELTARELEFQQQEGKLEKLEAQLEKTRIYATRDGQVVHATSARPMSWRGNDEPLEEGQSVRERQDLIYLPTADTMMAEVQIHESNLKKIAPGLRVQVKVDALQGKLFPGVVAKIAPLPDARSMFMNPDLKVYTTEIHIEGKHPDLRTGMSCEAEIVIESYDDATYVPIQAVVRRGGLPHVYRREATGFTAVPVEIGLDNNRMVRILSGIDEGDVVLLAPPLESIPERHEASPVSPSPGRVAPSVPGPAGDRETGDYGGFPRGEGPPGRDGFSGGESPANHDGAPRGDGPGDRRGFREGMRPPEGTWPPAGEGKLPEGWDPEKIEKMRETWKREGGSPRSPDRDDESTP